MNREAEIKEEIIRQLQTVASELSGYKVFIFGSRAGRSAKKRSDFDVGVIGEQPLPLRTFYHIEDLFDSIETLYKIDWVDLNRTTEKFRTEALKSTELIYG